MNNMKPQKEKDNTKKLIAIFSISIIVLIGLVVAGTYAFFTNSVIDRRGDNTTNLITGSVSEFGLKDGTITGDNLIPGDTVTKNFSLSNRSTGPVNFKLLWKDITNSFVNKQDLIITLTQDGKTLISEADNNTFPSTASSSVLKDNLTIPTGATQNFTLKITYRNTEQDQSGDMGKTISASIAIEAR